MNCPSIKKIKVDESPNENLGMNKIVYVYLEEKLGEISNECLFKYRVAAGKSIESDKFLQGHIMPDLTQSKDADLVFGIKKEKDESCPTCQL